MKIKDKMIGKQQMKCVAVTFVIMIIVMIFVYNLAFDVNASAEESLETAINEYNFTTDVEVSVLDTEKVGKYLYVLYAQDDHPGYGGLALLEKGFLGKYRFHNCDNFNWQLYNVKSMEINHKNYLLMYCLNDLPNVATYNLYSDFGRVGDVTYSGKAIKGPFLEIVETPELYQVTSWAIRYYDENNNEINEDDLVKLFEVSETGDGASVGTAEKGFIYIYLGIILLIGLVIIRYFLGL